MNDQENMLNYTTREWPDVDNLLTSGPTSKDPVERFIFVVSQIAPNISSADLQATEYLLNNTAESDTEPALERDTDIAGMCAIILGEIHNFFKASSTGGLPSALTSAAGSLHYDYLILDAFTSAMLEGLNRGLSTETVATELVWDATHGDQIRLFGHLWGYVNSFIDMGDSLYSQTYTGVTQRRHQDKGMWMLALKGLWILASYYICAPIQTDKGAMLIGNAFDLIPGPYAAKLSDSSIHPYFRMLLLNLPDEALDDGTKYITWPTAFWDYSALDDAALDDILNKYKKKYLMPQAALDIVRNDYGVGVQLESYRPYLYFRGMEVGVEQDRITTPQKLVGYGMLWSLFMLEQYYIPIEIYFQKFMTSSHASFAPVKTIFADLVHVSLDDFNGYVNPAQSEHVLAAHVKAAETVVDATGMRTGASVLRADGDLNVELISAALSATDVLLTKGGWDMTALGTYLRERLFTIAGASDSDLCNSYIAQGFLVKRLRDDAAIGWNTIKNGVTGEKGKGIGVIASAINDISISWVAEESISLSKLKANARIPFHAPLAQKPVLFPVGTMDQRRAVAQTILKTASPARQNPKKTDPPKDPKLNDEDDE